MCGEGGLEGLGRSYGGRWAWAFPPGSGWEGQEPALAPNLVPVLFGFALPLKVMQIQAATLGMQWLYPELGEVIHLVTGGTSCLKLALDPVHACLFHHKLGLCCT